MKLIFCWLLMLPSSMAFTRSFILRPFSSLRKSSFVSSPAYSTTICQAHDNDTSTTTVPIITWKACKQKECWRPTVQDVERISFGQPARRKGTGSRGVPHRLNKEERKQWDLAICKGFLSIAGSGWRAERREAPLLNSYRSWCDAKCQASIVVHKGDTGMNDELVLDLSPLRSMLKETVETARMCLEWLPGGSVLNEGQEEQAVSNDDYDDWRLTRPIYHIPSYCVSWTLPRDEAKKHAKELAVIFSTQSDKRESSKKSIGVKPGKSRRHGGYGIG